MGIMHGVGGIPIDAPRGAKITLEPHPFPGGIFEKMLVVDDFPYLRNQESAVRELLRLLKPKGTMEGQSLGRPRQAMLYKVAIPVIWRSRFYCNTSMGTASISLKS